MCVVKAMVSHFNLRNMEDSIIFQLNMPIKAHYVGDYFNNILENM